MSTRKKVPTTAKKKSKPASKKRVSSNKETKSPAPSPHEPCGQSPFMSNPASQSVQGMESMLGSTSPRPLLLDGLHRLNALRESIRAYPMLPWMRATLQDKEEILKQVHENTCRTHQPKEYEKRIRRMVNARAEKTAQINKHLAKLRKKFDKVRNKRGNEMKIESLARAYFIAGVFSYADIHGLNKTKDPAIANMVHYIQAQARHYVRQQLHRLANGEKIHSFQGS